MADHRVRLRTHVRVQRRRSLTDQHDPEPRRSAARDQIFDRTHHECDVTEHLLRSEERRLVNDDGERGAVLRLTLQLVKLFAKLANEAPLCTFAQVPKRQDDRHLFFDNEFRDDFAARLFERDVTVRSAEDDDGVSLFRIAIGSNAHPPPRIRRIDDDGGVSDLEQLFNESAGRVAFSRSPYAKDREALTCNVERECDVFRDPDGARSHAVFFRLGALRGLVGFALATSAASETRWLNAVLMSLISTSHLARIVPPPQGFGPQIR